jgi:hypothetical protein
MCEIFCASGWRTKKKEKGEKPRKTRGEKRRLMVQLQSHSLSCLGMGQFNFIVATTTSLLFASCFTAISFRGTLCRVYKLQFESLVNDSSVMNMKHEVSAAREFKFKRIFIYGHCF